MTRAAGTDDLDALLGMLESAGSGLALIELPRDVALTAPAVSGVSTFLSLTGNMFILRDDAPPQPVRAGELALVPANALVRLSAKRGTARTIDSRDRLVQRGRWIVVPVPPGDEPVAQVAAARVIGSREAALDDVVVIDVKGCAIAGPLFRQLTEEVARGADGHAGFAMALMNACVVQAIRNDRGAREPSAPSLPRAQHGSVGRAVAAIRAHPGDEHSIDSLARLAGMGRSSFMRAFTRATGLAPQRYLQQTRLEEAAVLLGSTTLPVKAIAAATGFASRSHFSRAFREIHGSDPSAYRSRATGDHVLLHAESVPERTIDRASC